MVDVLILYEHKNRELENASLLATELEYRGYKVKIRCIYSLTKYFIKAKVLIVPHLYNDSQVIAFGKNFWMNNSAIIDMQYEQVLRQNQREGIHNPKGQAVYAQHTAWGQAQIDAYLSHGIARENTHIIGHVAMDLMRPEFDECFISREMIAKEFGLVDYSKWVLFISTFAYKEKTKEELEDCERNAPGSGVIRELSINAQKTVVEWLVQSAEKHPDTVYIYRRHPAEREDPELQELERRIPNFKCIDKYSIRQWVRVADNFYTWYSTSIADTYFGNKMCYILRPEPIPEEFELEIMQGADVLKTYEEFECSLERKEDHFPIADEMMKYYYGNDRNNIEEFAFIKLAKLCEKVMFDESMHYNYEYGTSRWDMYNYKSPIMILESYILTIIFEVCTFIKFPIPTKWHKKKLFKDIVYYGQEGYKASRDVTRYKKKFKKFVTNLHERDQ